MDDVPMIAMADDDDQNLRSARDSVNAGGWDEFS
jgi:hypothetical protein